MSFNPYFPVHNYPYGSQPEFAPSWLLGEYNRLVTFINETLGVVVLPTASDITYNDGVAHLGETTVQGAIEKLKYLIDNFSVPSMDASNVNFDKSGTSLSSTNVQTAIVELLGLIENFPVLDDASDINYDNSQSGMTADNVQEALDELKDTIDNLPSGSGLEVVDLSAVAPGTYSHEDSENMPIMQKLIDAYTNNGALMIKDASSNVFVITRLRVTATALMYQFVSLSNDGFIASYQLNVRNYTDAETRFFQFFENNSLRVLKEGDLPTLIYPNSYTNADITNDNDLRDFVVDGLMWATTQQITRFIDVNGDYWNVESVSVLGTDKTVKLATLAGGNIHILTFVVHNFSDVHTVTLDTSETTI